MLGSSLIALAALALPVAQAQIYTTTFTWVDGDTVVISQSTNALGATVGIQTLSTVSGTARTTTTTGRTSTTGLTTTTPTTTSRTSTSTSRRTTSSLDDDDETTTSSPTTSTTRQRVVGQPEPTTAETTTSWYGYPCEESGWCSSFVSPTWVQPTAVSTTPPAGTIQGLGDYQRSMNGAAASGQVAAGENDALASAPLSMVHALTAALGVVGGVVLGSLL